MKITRNSFRKLITIAAAACLLIMILACVYCYKIRMKYAITSSELRMMLEDKGISYNETSFSRKKPQKF